MVAKIDNLFTASRFVLPEQREAILQLKEDQKLVPQLEQQVQLQSWKENLVIDQR